MRIELRRRRSPADAIVLAMELKPGIERTDPLTELPFKTLPHEDGSVADR